MTEEELDISEDQLVEKIEGLETHIEELEEEKKEWKNNAKKIKANFENYKKKESDRKNKWQRQAEEKLAQDLISVMDNLERAIISAEEESTLLKGVKMVSDQLYETLQKKGLREIDAEGEEFDPQFHKAVDTETHEEHNKVIEQRRKGYMYDDKVLREAEVIVGKREDET